MQVLVVVCVLAVAGLTTAFPVREYGGPRPDFPSFLAEARYEEYEPVVRGPFGNVPEPLSPLQVQEYFGRTQGAPFTDTAHPMRQPVPPIWDYENGPGISNYPYNVMQQEEEEEEEDVGNEPDVQEFKDAEEDEDDEEDDDDEPGMQAFGNARLTNYPHVQEDEDDDEEFVDNRQGMQAFGDAQMNYDPFGEYREDDMPRRPGFGDARVNSFPNVMENGEGVGPNIDPEAAARYLMELMKSGMMDRGTNLEDVEENVQNMANPYLQRNFEHNMPNPFMPEADSQNMPGPRAGLNGRMQAPGPYGPDSVYHEAPVRNPTMEEEAAMEKYIAQIKKMAFQEPGEDLDEEQPDEEAGRIVVGEDNVMRYFNDGGWGKRGADEQE